MDLVRVLLMLAAILQLSLVAGRVTSHRKGLKAREGREFAEKRDETFGRYRDKQFLAKRKAKESRPVEHLRTQEYFARRTRTNTLAKEQTPLRRENGEAKVTKERTARLFNKGYEKIDLKDEILSEFESQLESLARQALEGSGETNTFGATNNKNQEFGAEVGGSGELNIGATNYKDHEFGDIVTNDLAGNGGSGNVPERELVNDLFSDAMFQFESQNPREKRQKKQASNDLTERDDSTETNSAEKRGDEAETDSTESTSEEKRDVSLESDLLSDATFVVYGNRGGGDLTRIEESNSTESLSAESNSTEREERGDIELTRDLFSDAMFEVSREMEESRQKARQHKQDSQQLSDPGKTEHYHHSNIPQPETTDDDLPVIHIKRNKLPGEEKPVDTTEGCNKQLFASTAVQLLYSHDGYTNGEDYSDNSECVFEIIAPDSHYLWIHFITFEVEEDSRCSFDYVQIYRDELSRDNNVTSKLCGLVSPGVVTVSSTLAYIHFHTDSSETERGFKLEYKAYDPSMIPQRSCIFGTEPTCAFQCHCAESECDPINGGCLSGGCTFEKETDEKVENRWFGDGCYMGNVALNKHAYSLMGDADAVTDGYKGTSSIPDHCTVVKADSSADSVLTVDLGGLYQVDYIKVYGAPIGTPEAETLRDFYVKQTSSRDIASTGCNTYLGQVEGSDTLDCQVVSRFISITRFQSALYTNYDMVICEIQVFGHKVYDVDCDRCEGSFCDEDKLCPKCQVTFTEPTCGNIIDCGVPPPPEHGGVHYTSTHRPSVATFYCDEGYTLKGYSFTLCGYENDEWDGTAHCVRECGAVPYIDNAIYPSVDEGIEGDYVEYICEENYLQMGGTYLVCSDGEWINPTNYPKCQELECKDIQVNDPNIHLVYSNGTDLDSVYIYSCDEGFYIRGQVNNLYTMRCQLNGEWDKPTPICEAFCGDFYESTSGTLASQNYPNKYPEKLNCTWVIHVPRPGDRLSVRIVNLDVEDSTNCIYDSLNIYESNGHRKLFLGKFCGRTLPMPMVTKGNYLIVNFYADEAFEGQGFLLQYDTIRSEDPMDASEALLAYYPMLVGGHVLHMDSHIFAEAVTFMKSYLVTVTRLENHGDCLFLLEAIDAAYNILAHHALPEVQKYIVSSFSRAQIHAPSEYQTMNILQEVSEKEIIQSIIEQIYAPFIELGNRAILLSGLDIVDASSYDAMKGLLFHDLEEILFEKMYITPMVPLEELAITIAIEAHRRVIAVLNTSPNSDVVCEPLAQTLSNFLPALDNTVNNVEQLLSKLPMIVKAAFGDEDEDFADLFIDKLKEQYEIFAKPLDVIINLRNELFNVDLEELEGISSSGTTPLPGVITPQELQIKFTGPATAVLLEYGLELTIEVTKEEHIKADLMKNMLDLVPQAKIVAIKDLDIKIIESLIETMIDRAREMSYVSCLDPKLASMLIGFAEVQLLDIALNDHNISSLGAEVLDIIAQEIPRTDAQAIVVNLMTMYRSVLFNSYRRYFLIYEASVQKHFSSNVPTKTTPLDLLLMLSAGNPQTAYEFIDQTVEIMLLSMRSNITCPSSDIYREIGLDTETFVSYFSINAIMQEIYSNLLFFNEISASTTNALMSRMRAHMAGLLDMILKPYEYLRVISDDNQYKMIMKEYVLMGLSSLVHNAVQPVSSKTEIEVEDLIRVIQRQHEGMKAVLEQYIRGLKEILSEVGGEAIDICQVYPQACDLRLDFSLTKR